MHFNDPLPEAWLGLAPQFDPRVCVRICMDCADKREADQLADERAFEQAATIARLKSDGSRLFLSIKVALTWMETFRRQSGTNEAGPLAQDIENIQTVIQNIA